MAQRRPVTSHPAFAPLVALWFAALLGLGLAVLPVPLLERALASIGLGAALPLTTLGRVAASAAAALLGGLAGLALVKVISRRSLSDPRPVYSEPEPAPAEPVVDRRALRPLRVREELAEGLIEPTQANAQQQDGASAREAEQETQEPPTVATASDEGFMILSPRPAQVPPPAADLDSLLAQFDTALAAFRAGDEPRPAGPGGPDPVHVFVARQTGTPSPSPLGGTMPDHQAELRAALDKLARANRRD